MAKTHEVNLTSSLFSSVRDNNYYITKNNDYEWFRKVLVLTNIKRV